MQACWVDESDNLRLKRLAASAHVHHWHARVLDAAAHLQRRDEAKRARTMGRSRAREHRPPPGRDHEQL